MAISAGALAAIAYLILVLGSLTVFSTVYRRRKALQSANLEPWFPPNRERDVYLTLLHLDSPCPPKLLKAALLERAKEDISRIYTLRESKTAATQLLAQGSISESTWQQIIAAEAELNAEIADVIAEATALGGSEWGQSILPQANEYHQKTTILNTIERSKKQAEEERKKWDEELVREKEWKDKQRESALKELSAEETVKTSGAKSDVNALDREINTGNGGRAEGSTERKKKKNKK